MWHLKHQLIVSDWERKKNSEQWPISLLYTGQGSVQHNYNTVVFNFDVCPRFHNQSPLLTMSPRNNQFFNAPKTDRAVIIIWKSS